ncbi:MAG: SH3 domain-containing protein [Pseudomonadota bacterium]
MTICAEIRAKFFGLFFLVLAGAVLPGLGIAGERMSVTSGVTNVRSGPGNNYDVLWQIEKYHPIDVVEKKGSWYHFKDFEGDLGWVHRSMVGTTRSVITVKGGCNVRSGPGTDNSIVFTVEKGVPFKVLETKGKWIRIEHADKDTGWIYSDLVW